MLPLWKTGRRNKLGARSKKVAESCLEGRFEEMAHMEGGFEAWKQKNVPYIGTDMATGAPKKMPA